MTGAILASRAFPVICAAGSLAFAVFLGVRLGVRRYARALERVAGEAS